MTLSLADLPGRGWTQVGEKSWRVGSTIPREKSDATRRAHQARLYSATRYFAKDGLEWGFWSQVAEYVSREDAASKVSSLPAQILSSHGRTLRTQTMLDWRVPGVEGPLVFEQSSAGKDGSFLGQYAGGLVGNVVFVVACTTTQFGRRDEPTERWPWPELIDVASLQAKKIARIQNELTH